MKTFNTTTISELKPNQRFFCRGMWYDFVSTEFSNGFQKVICKDGYSDRVYTLLVTKNETVYKSKAILTA